MTDATSPVSKCQFSDLVLGKDIYGKHKGNVRKRRRKEEEVVN